jgi:hypothetical protein
VDEKQKMTPDIQNEIRSKVLLTGRLNDNSTGRKITIIEEAEAKEFGDKYHVHLAIPSIYPTQNRRPAYR